MSDSAPRGQQPAGDSPNDHSTNGHPPGGSPGADLGGLLPRIAPPEGARAARGETFSEPKDEIEAAPLEAMASPDSDGNDDDPSDSGPWDADLNGEAALSSVEIEKRADEAERFRVSSLRDDTPHDKELGLLEHLTELRQRLLNSIIAVVLMMFLTWHFKEQLQAWFSRPIQQVLASSKVSGTPGVPAQPNIMVNNEPMGFLNVALQFSFVSALILVMPFVFYQVWRFIEPAMTHSERRYTLILVPFSSALFFMGAGLGFAVSPMFFEFFLAFQPPGVAAFWDYSQCLTLMAKMLLVFGLAFQVPVITIFMAKIGLVTRNILIEYWRHAVVVIFTLVAIATPTWDPMTLTVCAVPPCLLYVLSIWLIKWL